MKKIIITLTIALSFATFQSCKNDKEQKSFDEISDSLVPASVKSAFSAKYAAATEVKWEDAHEDSIKTFKAKFTLNGKKMKVEFDANGTVVKEKEDD